MMGAVAESHLGKSLVSATVLMAVLLFILSAVPFYLKQNQEAENLPPAEAPAEGTSSTEQEESEYEPEAVDAGEKPLTTPEQSTADALGIGEQKVADPKSNPLDSSGEDLLDGLDDRVDDSLSARRSTNHDSDLCFERTELFCEKGVIVPI